VTIGKVVRAVAGLIVLLLLVLTVRNWWTEYRAAAPKKGETTATAPATATPPPPATPGPTVSVLVDGLNYREKPDATGKSLRGLKKGEKLTLVNQAGSWLQLRDAGGAVGWVTNNPQYLRIEKKKK